jgi:uncharacterized protein YecT (DUF1311 family)
MRRILLSACFAIVAAASAARAQECDRNDDSQSGMNTCAAEDYATADAKLNSTYQAIIGGVDDATKQLLQTAQQGWIVFRNAECNYAASGSQGGSIHPMVVSECLTRLTNDRTRQLKADTTCPQGESCANSGDNQDDDVQ